jgi:hypothetical protein
MGGDLVGLSFDSDRYDSAEDADTSKGLWVLVAIAQERAAVANTHDFESHAMAYERLLRLASDLKLPRPALD